jgi:D-proline reductase (dithiol) PrdB
MSTTGSRFDWVPFMKAMLAPAPYTPLPNFPPPQRTALRRTIAESTIGIVTLAGVQRRDEPLLGEANDLSFRLLDRTTPFSELTIAHRTPVRVFAEQDLNVVYPRDRLVELEAEGTIGHLAERAVSLVGSITRYGALVEETVPRIHDELARHGVDLAILVPI